MSNPKRNISHNSKVRDCKNKCDLSFNYQASSCVVENRGDYLQFKYDNNNSSIVFNNSKYSITDVRLYRPSIHTYGFGGKAAAELIILHTNNFGDKLAVCAPIKESGSGSEASTMLQTIVPQVSPTIGESTNVNLKNFTLNSFVPQTSYFYYNGSLPWEPFDPDYNFIVFTKNDALATINSETMLKLNKLISEHKKDLDSGTENNKTLLFFNANGVNSSDGDDIMIDCTPVGESHETEEYLKNTGDKQEEEKKRSEMKENFINFGWVTLLILLIFAICYMGYKAYKGWNLRKLYKDLKPRVDIPDYSVL